MGTDAGPWVMPANAVLGRGRRRALCPDPGSARSVRVQQILTSLSWSMAPIFFSLSRARAVGDPRLKLSDTDEFDQVATVRVLIEGGRLHLAQSSRWCGGRPALCYSARLSRGLKFRVVGRATPAPGRRV